MIDYNWKKQASAAVRDADAELAFMKMASRSIEDKAAPLFTAPFYLGFETVYTNNNHSRMIGIFGFRVGKNLIYIPVFYIDGALKGTELIYLQNEKQFVVLNPEWCDYLINKYEISQGEMIEDEIADKASQEMDLRWLAYPPNLMKSASESNKPFVGSLLGFTDNIANNVEEDAELSFKDYFNKLANEQDTKSLRRFIDKAGLPAFEKIAEAVNNDFDFANNIVSLLDTEDWYSEDLVKESKDLADKAIKQASEQKVEYNEILDAKNCILIHSGKFNPYAKVASEQIEKGLTIEDRRDQSKLKVIYANYDEEFKSINNEPCVYEILGADGTTNKMVVLTGKSDGGKQPVLMLDCKDNSVIFSNNVNASSDYGLYSSGGPHVTPFDLNGNNFNKILGIPVADESYNDYLTTSPEINKVYGIFDLNDNYISDECFLIKGKKEDSDGIVTYDVTPFNGYSWLGHFEIENPGLNMTLKLNPDAPKSDIKNRVFVKDYVKFIPINVVKRPVGNETTVDAVDKVPDAETITTPFEYAVKASSFCPGTIENYALGLTLNYNMDKSVIDKTASESYLLKISGYNKYEEVNRLGATIKLMADLDVSKETAEEVLDNVDSKGSYSFYHNKIAASKIILRPEPEFTESLDPDLGVNIFNGGTKIIQTDEVVDEIPNPRYGDKAEFLVESTNLPSSEKDKINNLPLDNETNSLLLTATPNVLAEVARQTGNKNIFEHGIIGTLSKTYDAGSYISEFIPDLKQGLDKLGRLVFLYYWKPQDFTKYYGSDDLIELENMLLSNFKQLGDLVLQLLLKTKDIRINVSNNESVM